MSAGMPDPEWASEHRGTLSPDSFLCRIFESALIVDAVKDERHTRPDPHHDRASCLGVDKNFDLKVGDVFDREGAVGRSRPNTPTPRLTPPGSSDDCTLGDASVQ